MAPSLHLILHLTDLSWKITEILLSNSLPPQPLPLRPETASGVPPRTPVRAQADWRIQLLSTQLLLWALPRDLSLRAFEGCRLLQEREGPGTGWQWDLWVRLTSQWLYLCFFLSRHPRKGRRDAQSLTHRKGRIGRCVERDVKNPGAARRADRGQREAWDTVDHM